jgi:hypothetical protein
MQGLKYQHWTTRCRSLPKAHVMEVSEARSDSGEVGDRTSASLTGWRSQTAVFVKSKKEVLRCSGLETLPWYSF